MTELKHRKQVIPLVRQSSSFGMRSSMADQELLALNALRDGVTVIKSGVQMERTRNGENDDQLREEQLSALRDPTQRFSMVWRVRLFDLDGYYECDEEWTLRSVSRGIRDALNTGNMVPGSKWKIWIPAELGGWAVKTKKHGNTVAFEVEVLSLDRAPNYAWFLIKGFLGAVFIAVFSFFFSSAHRRSTKLLTGRVANSSAPSTPRPSKIAAATDFQEQTKTEVTISGPPIVKLVVFEFLVDTIDFGECLVEVCANGKCGKWFLSNLKRFTGQPVITNTDADAASTVNGLLIVASNDFLDTSNDTALETTTDVETENEHIWCEDLWVSQPKGNSPYRLFLDPLDRALAVSQQFSSIDDDRRWVCIGRVISGDESIEAVRNCEDGGILAYAGEKDATGSN